MSKFGWFDLGAVDTAKVGGFYAGLFGWPAVEATDAGAYRTWFMDGERPWAGVVESDPGSAGRWVPYVQVDDLEAATARATSLGATIVQEKTEGPGGTAVMIADPAGAPLALWIPR